MVELALILPQRPDTRWHLARQMGVESAVIHPLEVGDGKTEWSRSDLRMTAQRLAEVGLEFSVLEGSVPISDRVRTGAPGRDEDIERFKRFVRDCGAVGIPIVAYDWMAGLRWARTEVHVEARGGSYVSGFDAAATPDDPPPVSCTEEDLWSGLEHFLEEVVPVAEEAGVSLALHPDDPPRERAQGIPRVIRSPAAYNRVLEIVPNEHNGITFCQGNFAAMGVDIPRTIRRFGDRIHFVHFRDVRGDADRFVETWHDDGPTDMQAAMDAYRDIGFDGPMRPDHVPTMAGEDNSRPGYHTKARLFAIGYMRGLLD